ncbi:MAG: hypothetical protein Tp118DCM00d2C30442581_8 [Prokaryotic dsDNA virus sp.]|nr:MAG: hypothetical protein Tp118DCM00d2C30442581_8 [Prokaryotic dsDNA virus sp.]|tara:strand:+ start:10435 stop:10770 length:336 start_codon:yes stop_codon:yes gene_type:complete
MTNKIKIGKDEVGHNLQFSHLKTLEAFNLTSAAGVNTSIAANYDVSLVITPLSGEAYVNIGTTVSGVPAAGETPGTVGVLIKNGASYTTIIRKGEKIAVSATCNICPLGEE